MSPKITKIYPIHIYSLGKNTHTRERREIFQLTWASLLSIFRGAVIDEGEGVMLVEKVGVNTFYGQFAEELGQKDDRESPLQVRSVWIGL